MDKFAADMAVDLKDSKVAALSIWMGALQTERLLQLIASDRDKYGYLENITETPDFTGHVIWALYNDPELMALSGQTVIGAAMAQKSGIRDAGGSQPPASRQKHQVGPRQTGGAR